MTPQQHSDANMVAVWHYYAHGLIEAAHKDWRQGRMNEVRRWLRSPAWWPMSPAYIEEQIGATPGTIARQFRVEDLPICDRCGAQGVPMSGSLCNPCYLEARRDRERASDPDAPVCENPGCLNRVHKYKRMWNRYCSRACGHRHYQAKLRAARGDQCPS